MAISVTKTNDRVEPSAKIIWNSDRKTKSLSILRHLKFFRFYASLPVVIDENCILTNISKVYLIIFGSFAILHTMHTIWPSEGAWDSYGPFTTFLYTAEKFINVFIPFVVMYMSVRNRYRFRACVISLIKIQRIFGLTEYRMFSSIKALLLHNALTIFIYMALQFLQASLGEKPYSFILDEFGWAILYLFVFSPIYLFGYLLNCVCACFQRLSTVRAIGKTKDTGFAITYSRLVDVAVEINTCFDVQVSLNLFVGSLTLLDFIGYQLGDPGIGDNETFATIVYCSGILVSMLSVLHFCHSTVRQAEKCNMELINYLIHHKHSIYLDNSQVLLHLCGRKQLQFSAGKCVTINYNLGLSMLAAFITYMVVLYQIEYASNKSGPPRNTTLHE